jgi:cobalt/nickel transport system permease protein
LAHIHLEDGSFSLFWVAVWWIIALVVLEVALVWIRSGKKTDNRKLTIAAFCTAAAFAVFQVEIPLFGGVHLNLTPLIGILVGPVFGSLIVLIINIMSAAFGHGGWGLIGANVLINLTEVIVAYGTWKVLKRVFPRAFIRAVIATIAGLFCGNLVMIAIILVSGIQGVTQTSSQILTGLILIAGINMGVAVIEAFITGMIIAAIIKARPDMLEQ